MMSITSTTGQIVKKLARNLPMWHLRSNFAV